MWEGEIKVEDDGSIKQWSVGQVLSWWWWAWRGPEGRRGGTLTQVHFPGIKDMLSQSHQGAINIRVKGQIEANTLWEQRCYYFLNLFSYIVKPIQEERLLLSQCYILLISPQNLKSGGDEESALPEAIPTLLDAKLADTWETYGTTPSISTSAETEEEESPGDKATAGAVSCHEQEPSGKTLSSEEEGEGEEESCDITWKKSQKLANGLMRFSTDLLREVQQEFNGNNVILSPLSIALALSNLALGNLLEQHLLLPFPEPLPPGWRHWEPTCKMQRLNTSPST